MNETLIKRLLYYWWCSVRDSTQRCPATVIQTGDNFLRGARQHGHPAKPGIMKGCEIETEVICVFMYLMIQMHSLLYPGNRYT